MEVRLLKPEDMFKLREIHKKFYKDEFIFPYDRVGKVLDQFVVAEGEEIITFGTLELTAEIIAITNKDFSAKIRREALYKLYDCLVFNADVNGHDIIHCMAIDDEKWFRHLKKVGFQECRGKYLYNKVSGK
ncbi:MAG TPA: hypothetical protein VNX68_06885 [Nitrosopumilaceae archaeon]|jgi:hypothetical protein|nr:hypothetical protein [Nitrosopumilaceae archaeon]